MPEKIYFTSEDLLMNRDLEYPLSGELEANLLDLLDAANAMAAAYEADTGRILEVRSAYRPGRYNVAAGGARRSAHLYCLAIDWADPDGAVDEWVMANLERMRDFGFVGIEHPDSTVGWSHCDLVQRYDMHGNPFQVFRV